VSGKLKSFKYKYYEDGYDEVLVSREMLNKIKFSLDGSWVEIVEVASSPIDRKKYHQLL